MKRVTSQNIGNEGLMMSFEQIKKKIAEIHFGDELFIVIFGDNDGFIQVRQPCISDIYEIQMRSNHSGITEFREKGVIGITEVEKYFQAYFYNEDWLLEDFGKWIDISEDLSYNLQKISNNGEYFRDKLEPNQIIEVLSNLETGDTLVLLCFNCYLFEIYLRKVGSISQYSLNIRKDNKPYSKTVNSFETVKNFVLQYLNNEKIDLKAWQSPYY